MSLFIIPLNAWILSPMLSSFFISWLTYLFICPENLESSSSSFSVIVLHLLFWSDLFSPCFKVDFRSSLWVGDYLVSDYLISLIRFCSFNVLFYFTDSYNFLFKFFSSCFKFSFYFFKSFCSYWNFFVFYFSFFTVFYIPLIIGLNLSEKNFTKFSSNSSIICWKLSSINSTSSMALYFSYFNLWI